MSKKISLYKWGTIICGSIWVIMISILIIVSACLGHIWYNMIFGAFLFADTFVAGTFLYAWVMFAGADTVKKENAPFLCPEGDGFPCWKCSQWDETRLNKASETVGLTLPNAPEAIYAKEKCGVKYGITLVKENYEYKEHVYGDLYIENDPLTFQWQHAHGVVELDEKPFYLFLYKNANGEFEHEFIWILDLMNKRVFGDRE